MPLLRRGLPDRLPGQGQRHRRRAADARDRPTAAACASRGVSASTTSPTPHRLTAPLIRRGGRAQGRLGGRRPGESHTAISGRPPGRRRWTRPPAGLRKIRDREGGGALAGYGSAKGSNEEAYLVQKLVRTGFGTNNVDHCTRLCHASSVAALMEGIGSAAVTAPFTACEESDVIVVIGANPTENHPVAATYFKQAAKRGAELDGHGPSGPGAAAPRHLDAPVQAGRGRGAAQRAAQRHHRAKGSTTADYVAAHTEGLRGVEAARGRSSRRRPWRRSAASTPGPCARWRGSMPAPAFRHDLLGHGDLAAHPRHRQRPLPHRPGPGHRAGGTPRVPGSIPLRGQNNVQGASDAGLIPMFYPDYRSVEARTGTRRRFEEVWDMALDPRRGLTVMEIVDAVHAGQIKGMYIMGENPAMSDPDVQHAREALARTRAPGGAGDLSHRDGVSRRRGAAGVGVAGEGRHRHQQQPPGADGAGRRSSPRPVFARTGGSSRRSPGAWASIGAMPALRTSSRR